MNAELYRQGVDAWNARDMDGFVALAHPDVEFRSRLTDVEGAAYRGHDGVRQYFADLSETFGDVHMEIEEIEERGDWVVAKLRLIATGSASGAHIGWEVHQATRYRSGLAVETHSERTRGEALAAAGLG